MEFERRQRRHTHIDLAPLVDVVFLLLLFFMLTFHLAAPPALRVNLPASATAEAARDHGLTVSVTAAGAVALGQRDVALEHLSTALQNAGAAKASQPVRIVADQDVKLALLVQVMDQVRLSGAEAFAIATRK